MDKKKRYILICAALLVVLIVVIVFSTSKNKNKSPKNSSVSNNVVEKNEYYKAKVGVSVFSDKTATITGEAPSYKNPVIPNEFTAIETPKATWSDNDADGCPDGWNDGLVLQDEYKNEYVWIPVDGVNVKYEKGSYTSTVKGAISSAQTKDDGLPPAIADKPDSESEQIKKYGGFYISRYEASLPDDQTTEDLLKTKKFTPEDNNSVMLGRPQSKAGKFVWNNVDYYNAKTKAEYVITTSSVCSGLVTGTQWDAMLQFISQEVDVDGDSTSWGNYYDNNDYTITGYCKTGDTDELYVNGTYEGDENDYRLLQTGKFGEIVKAGSPKNLFDIAGNVGEWTAEIVDGNLEEDGNAIVRGGNYLSSGEELYPSLRIGLMQPKLAKSTTGFRFVLYID